MLYTPPQLVQTAFAEIDVNVSTSSIFYADIPPLVLTLTTESNPIEVHFAACAEVLLVTVDLGFRLLLDDVVVSSTRGRISGSGQTTCPTMRYKSERLAAGEHTVKVQWRTALFTSAMIRPTTAIRGSGSLLVREVTV